MCYMLVMRAGEAGVGVTEKVELVPKCVGDVLKRNLLSSLAESICVQGTTIYGLRKGMRRGRLAGPGTGPSSFW